MYVMDHHITFVTDGKKYRLQLMYSVKIEESVEQLADTAVIILPEYVQNKPLNLQEKIKRGSEVEIQLGYDGNLRTEFLGYVQEVRAINGSLEIQCEDAIWFFRKDVADKQLKPTSVIGVANYLIEQLGEDFTIDCDFDLGYESFVIHQATAFDVLKKISEETKANIYLDSVNRVLHIHPPYKQKTGSVVYDMARNVEDSSLEYRRSIDRKIEITVESIDKNGVITSVQAGTTGGDKTTVKVTGMSIEDMRKIADAELLKRSSDGYQGTFSTWLIPHCASGFTAKIKDPDYPDQEGQYFVSKVVTEFSSSGAKRTIHPSIKL